MQSSDYAIRKMNRNDIDTAIEWAAQEGWNPGLHDADCFYAADPEGFLIGEINNESVATISAVKYGENFGFIGFYIVKPEYRGKGFGLKIWNAAMEALDGRNIGLDGVVEQQDNYKKSGFKLAYRNVRYEGMSGGNVKQNPAIINLKEEHFNLVEKYDQKFFPSRRTGFLKSWLSQPNSITLGIMENAKLCGYGVARVCRNGYKLGPLFADDKQFAEDLFGSLKSKILPGKPIFLDIPETNSDAVALVKKNNMKLVFETARMYTGDFPDLPVDKIFGVTTFELG